MNFHITDRHQYPPSRRALKFAGRESFGTHQFECLQKSALESSVLNPCEKHAQKGNASLERLMRVSYESHWATFVNGRHKAAPAEEPAATKLGCDVIKAEHPQTGYVCNKSPGAAHSE